MFQKTKCNDKRCLYLVKNVNQKKKNLSVITKETREGSGLWERCNICGLSINKKGVNRNKAEEFYNENYQKINSLEAGKKLSSLDHFEARKVTVKKIANKIYPYLNSKMSIYELGAGSGELLYYLKSRVKSCAANEINKVYSDFIKKKLKIKSSHKNFLEDNFKNKFDMIISICTIDHIYETRKILEKIYKDLRKGGLFYLEVPNDNQILNKYLSPSFSNEFSKFMYQKAHYYSFNLKTISKLLKNVGFKIKKLETRQEYTAKNFLNWYFARKPQKSFDKATSEKEMLRNFNDKFEKEINKIFKNFDKQFEKTILKNNLGDTICVLAKK